MWRLINAFCIILLLEIGFAQQKEKGKFLKLTDILAVNIANVYAVNCKARQITD